MNGLTVIHKFEIGLGPDPIVIEVPESAKVLLTGPWTNPHAEGWAIWFEIPIDGGGDYCSPVRRTFEVWPTGKPMPGGRAHVGSFRAGDFIFHVFECVRHG